MPKHSLVYSDLESDGVPQLPDVMCGGDVCWEFEEDEEGNVAGMRKSNDGAQETITQFWAGRPQKDVPWRRKGSALRKLVHHRIAHDMLYPIDTVQNAEELVQAIRDMIESKLASSC